MIEKIQIHKDENFKRKIFEMSVIRLIMIRHTLQLKKNIMPKNLMKKENRAKWTGCLFCGKSGVSNKCLLLIKILNYSSLLYDRMDLISNHNILFYLLFTVYSRLSIVV